MYTISHEQKKVLKILGVAILALICLASIISFTATFKKIYKAGELHPIYSIHGSERVNHRVTIDTIQPWMTFNYLNVVFNMPASYLQNGLGIIDPSYPNIRIDTYIKRHKLNSTVFFTGVKQVITSYTNK